MLFDPIEEWHPSRLSPAELERDLNRFAETLHACVAGGASVNFVLPFSVEDAKVYWRDRVLPEVQAGTRRLLMVRGEGMIAGSVQIAPAGQPNQRHRADVVKLLVHPRARRRGIARSLMIAIESVALSEGRSLLTLDTKSGDAGEPLYLSLGYVLMGVIPRYSHAAATQEFEDASFLYKELSLPATEK